MVGRENRNCIKCGRRIRLATECKGEVAALGTVHPDTPSPAPDLYAMRVLGIRDRNETFQKDFFKYFLEERKETYWPKRRRFCKGFVDLQKNLIW